jgi:RNA polymerase sigma factor (sigma-70 family)
VIEQKAKSDLDQLLLPFVQSTDEARAQVLLTELLSVYAEPIIKKVINHKLRFSTTFTQSDMDDVQSDAQMNLLSRLCDCKADPQHKAINDFRNYAAVTAYRACYEYLRRKFPERHKLKNCLRYLLHHNEAFALWETAEGNLLCGFAAWQTEPERPPAKGVALLADEAAQSLPLPEILTLVFRCCNAPIEIDELVNLIGEGSGITESLTTSTVSVESLEQIADRRPDIDEQVSQQQQLERLWAEICALPVRQRAALLLNLKDGKGRGCIALFQLTGIATLRQMAELIEMPIEEFARLWNELPIEDARIAALLQLTRQQVINLRKSARERLARRLKIF